MKIQDALTKEELESLTTIYDKFGADLAEKAKSPMIFNKLRMAGQRLLEKNREKLQTNIIGKQITVMPDDEESFLSVLGYTHDDFLNAIKESQYFAKFGELKLASQLSFSLPLILLAFEYAKIKKDEEGRFIFLMTFFKPYASRESLFFKYGVNEDQMLYTVENLTGKSDIKQYGTVMNIIVKKAGLSYANYFSNVKPSDKLTDKKLHEIYTSGVASRVNSFLNGIAEEYKNNKGKYLPYEDNAVMFVDDDEGDDYEERNINSDAALKMNAVSKALIKVSSEPVDTGIIRLVCAQNFGISRSDFYPQLITNLVKNTAENRSADLQKFLASLINSFLFTINTKTKKRYTMTDFKTPVWPATMSKKVYKDKHTSDLNIKYAKSFLEEMLLTYCPEYVSGAATKKRLIKNAYFMYWVWFLQKTARS